jgi:hypothetical protein
MHRCILELPTQKHNIQIPILQLPIRHYNPFDRVRAHVYSLRSSRHSDQIQPILRALLVRLFLKRYPNVQQFDQDRSGCGAHLQAQGQTKVFNAQKIIQMDNELDNCVRNHLQLAHSNRLQFVLAVCDQTNNSVHDFERKRTQ